MELISFNCNACQQILKVGAENAGKQAKCPRCGAAMVIPHRSVAGPAPASDAVPYEDIQLAPPRRDEPDSRRGSPRYRDDDYDEDRPSRRPRRREDDYEEPSRRRGRYEDDYDDRSRPPGPSPRQQWRKVRIGLLIIFIASCVASGAFGVALIGRLIASINILGNTRNFSAYNTAALIVRIGTILLLLTNATAIAGYCFGVFAPKRYGAFGLGIAILVVAGVKFLLFLIFDFIPTVATVGYMHSFGLVLTFGIFLSLLTYAEWGLMAFFMRAIGFSFKRYGLASGGMGFFIFVACAAGYALLTTLILLIFQPRGMVTFEGMRTHNIIQEILHWVEWFLQIGIIIWYIILVWKARDAID